MQTLRTAAIGSTVRVVKLHGEGAIKREMNSAKWTWFAIGYQCGFAYVVALIIYQLGSLLGGYGNVLGTIVALLLIAALIYLLVRPYRESDRLKVDLKRLSKSKA